MMPAKSLETKKLAQAKWRNAHRDHLREYSAKRYAANRERILAVNQAWRDRNPDKIKAIHLRKTTKRRILIATFPDIPSELLTQKWEYWGGLCWMCRKPAEGWDHVKPLAKDGAHCLANLRPACKSCNSRKSAQWPFKGPTEILRR